MQDFKELLLFFMSFKVVKGQKYYKSSKKLPDLLTVCLCRPFCNFFHGEGARGQTPSHRLDTCRRPQ